MKCAIVLADDIKQIMFAPENKSEERALKMIDPDDEIAVERYTGSFYENYDSRTLGYSVSMCQGGYLRAFRENNCLMLVLKKKT